MFYRFSFFVNVFEFQETLLRFPQISLILNSKLADAFLSFHRRSSSEAAYASNAASHSDSESVSGGLSNTMSERI